MRGEKKRLGTIGENYAVEYLKGKKYRILERNIYVGRGEIDIVAQRGALIVFVEVKTRRNDEYVDILDSIDREKEEALVRSCEEYLAINNLSNYEYRIDLIGIIIRDARIEKFEHVEGII